MSVELLALLQGRQRHFRMESGYHSSWWYNLNALFADRVRLDPFVEELANKLSRYRPEVVCGPQTGGAVLARLVADKLGCEPCATEQIAPAEAAGLFSVRYELPAEIGTRLARKVVVVVDDAISAGSAMKGSLRSLGAADARVVACGALIVFGDAAAQFCLERQLALEAVAYAPFAMWPPGDCPLCTAGLPLEVVSDAAS